MERYDAMRIYLRVVELASFTAAADTLGLPKASVSLAVRQLEDLTGTRLLHRTTRRVNATAEGRAFYERCRDLVADLEDAESMFKEGGELSGRLRVDLPHGLAHSVLLPHLPGFLYAHPGLELEVSTTDRKVDPIKEGFDAVLRVGLEADPSLVARRLGEFEVANCASPSYLARHGTPTCLADLAEHHLVHYTPNLGSRPFGFEYRVGDEYRTLAMSGRVTVNGTDAYAQACLAGLGIIQAPMWGMREYLAQGLLCEVLPELRAEPMPVTLLYPQRRYLARRVKALVSWIETTLTESGVFG